jgi:tetratricopeptide (TPR) repeat protein
MRWRDLLGLLGILVAAAPAQAEWLEAKSRHFTLISDTSEKTLRQQSEALERLDWGLRRFLNVADEPDIASRKVTVFLVNDGDVRRLCQCTNAAGFYLSRVSGSIAFGAKGGWTDGNDFGRIVLFHEYAHHFLLGTYDIAFPAWYSEGFAEFASTMRITDQNATIGYAAQHRAYGLMEGQRFTARQMFGPKMRLSAAQMDAFYGRGWLMTHYFSFDRARNRQLLAYIGAINRGTPSVTAAEEAFGDLQELDRSLSGYLGRRRLAGMAMPFGDTGTPPITIRPLTKGEADLIDLRMQSVRGVDREAGQKLYAKAAPIAARYDDDPVAQGWLAEMAFDAGENDAALAAAAKALARDPKSGQALLYQGRLKLRRLTDAKSTDAAAWNAARDSIIAANRVDPDDPEPLWWFWQSFMLQGIEPRASSIKGLYRAQELAPQDDIVRFAAAMARIEAGEIPAAQRLLRPLAYHPHAPADNPASRVLAALDAGKVGKAAINAADAKEEGGAPTAAH